MVRHFIIMSDSYSEHTRIALDILEKTQDDVNYITDIVLKIKKACKGEAPFSTHSICADTEEWESVVKVDPYFKDVKVIDSVEEFIAKIMKDRIIRGFEVARYILTKISCSHLKLEKLCYLCYADYLCKTGNRLFEDKIYAFGYGPVVETVYEKYKKYGDLRIGEREEIIEKQERLELPRESRILFSEKGIEKVHSINETLSKYGDLSAWKLVEITHKENTPWAHSYSGENYDEISDKEILKWHCNK